jgi:hypothetical protein
LSPHASQEKRNFKTRRGGDELDQLCRLLRPLQCPKGRPHPGASRHEASALSGPPRVEVALCGAGRPGRELGPVSAARAGPSPRLMNNKAPASRQAGAIYRGVLLGEQRASKTRGQGSNPCTPAFADVAERSGPCLVRRFMPVRVRPSASMTPLACDGRHATLRRSKTRFDSWQGH